ncbi:MAG TPA: hypothetical protein VFO01_12335 [Trebonia sp.]|nr:hypothetical protein [Trebonia sp.]
MLTPGGDRLGYPAERDRFLLALQFNGHQAAAQLQRHDALAEHGTKHPA